MPKIDLIVGARPNFMKTAFGSDGHRGREHAARCEAGAHRGDPWPARSPNDAPDPCGGRARRRTRRRRAVGVPRWVTASSAGAPDAPDAVFRAPVLEAALRAKALVVAEDYRGYDPYDALASPVFGWPLLRARLARRVGQQVLKRSPVELQAVARHLEGPQSRDARARRPGLGAARRRSTSSIGTGTPPRRPASCANWRRSRRRAGAARAGATTFDWETRDSTLEAFVPTIVATGFVTRRAHPRRTSA